LLLAGNITTAALQWAYASTAEVPTTDSNAGRLANARIELTVESGCLGLGVSAGNGPFENQVPVEAGPMARVVDLPFVAKRPSSTIVVYNCSASAASRGIIHDARLQLVSDVELRPVGEDPRVDVP
jgi:hypothetical protein